MFLQRYTVVAVGIYDEICKIEEQIDSPRKRNLVQLNILPGASKVLEICAVAASPRVPGILNRLVCFSIPLSVWKSVGAWKNRWSQGKSRNEPRRHQVIGLLSTTWLEDASHRDAWKGETIAPRDICVSEERKLNWKPRGLGRRVACLPCPLYRGKISTNIFCYFNLETLSRGKLRVLKKLGNSNWYLLGFKGRKLQMQMIILTNGQFWKRMLSKMKKWPPSNAPISLTFAPNLHFLQFLIQRQKNSLEILPINHSKFKIEQICSITRLLLRENNGQ